MSGATHQPDGHVAAHAESTCNWIDAYLGVGSNLGDRQCTILRAVDALDADAHVRVIRVSALRETDPVGTIEQPKFLNAALHIQTDFSPRELLGLCMNVEARFGRIRSYGVSGGPRSLDLDVLLYGNLVMNIPGLTVPHPRMHERLFVLDPLAEIAGDVSHPVLGQTVSQLVAHLHGKRPTNLVPAHTQCAGTAWIG